MTTVPASIPVLRWAAERARFDYQELTTRFHKWPLWLSGKAQPTLKQLEAFARLTHTAIGYFFLPEPPTVTLPIPDFRTRKDQVLTEPSTNLLDTIYLCQQRQEWYHNYNRLHGIPALSFINSARIQDDPVSVAQNMRETLKLSAHERRELPTWIDALRQLINKAEDIGILIMASSIVGSNSHRKLDVGEFQGFALSNALAPLVFLNSADTKAAQIFTLAHELAHLWLGATGVSDSQAGEIPEQNTEKWCNRVAAELLVPIDMLRSTYRSELPLTDELQRLAREFKVSSLVVLRRLFDAGFIDQNVLWKQYRQERASCQAQQKTGAGGGDFYRTLGVRTSKRFARAIISSTLEGQTLFQDAFRMLGVRKTATFFEAARELGVIKDELPA
ncbi:MAG: ImmA/IrrE family metallo-endopeptidase [Burkholderiaceae bacterium]|nr:ImmA/IrrE family metallo-endopeptidase [Burkholderiaceae bacterium]